MLQLDSCHLQCLLFPNLLNFQLQHRILLHNHQYTVTSQLRLFFRTIVDFVSNEGWLKYESETKEIVELAVSSKL